MAFKQTHLQALDAEPRATLRVLSAAEQRELDCICLAIHRGDDARGATTAQIARFEEILGTLNIEPGATDWASLRARMNAIGGSVARTHPDDGAVRYVFTTWGGSILWTEDTLTDAIAEVASEEAEFVQKLDYARRLAVWKDGVAAKKARKAARDAAKAAAVSA